MLNLELCFIEIEYSKPGARNNCVKYNIIVVFKIGYLEFKTEEFKTEFLLYTSTVFETRQGFV